ncbi:transcriptional regulatory protein [Marmoricola endophyticus]|uniref:Transcriptional regulatory protein n=1 Tax=Marmoricola endophyticus TaxID=2040280 RepID=A0A917BD64_9ACTN|nr:response regulator [Marmoricola endophyticus]GGF36563.1 transcriptional regulatory protein [Marmoricola endophyticus]
MSVRVLVVEDEELAAEAHATYVRRVPGFELAGVARSAADAARLLAARPVDLVLLDMNLPDGHGLVLLRRLRAAGHDVDVIAVTSAREAEVVRSAVAQGVVLYLLKPFTFASFAEKLRQYAEYRARLGGEDGQVAQDEVDRAFGALRPAGGQVTPKGMSPETLEQVLEAVRAAEQAVSATEVAERTGVSRVTARRYLEQLTERGLLARAARYGGSGRPELEYRRV